MSRGVSSRSKRILNLLSLSVQDNELPPERPSPESPAPADARTPDPWFHHVINQRTVNRGRQDESVRPNQQKNVKRKASQALRTGAKKLHVKSNTVKEPSTDSNKCRGKENTRNSNFKCIAKDLTKDSVPTSPPIQLKLVSAQDTPVICKAASSAAVAGVSIEHTKSSATIIHNTKNIPNDGVGVAEVLQLKLVSAQDTPVICKAASSAAVAGVSIEHTKSSATIIHNTKNIPNDGVGVAEVLQLKLVSAQDTPVICKAASSAAVAGVSIEHTKSSATIIHNTKDIPNDGVVGVAEVYEQLSHLKELDSTNLEVSPGSSTILKENDLNLEKKSSYPVPTNTQQSVSASRPSKQRTSEGSDRSTSLPPEFSTPVGCNASAIAVMREINKIDKVTCHASPLTSPLSSAETELEGVFELSDQQMIYPSSSHLFPLDCMESDTFKSKANVCKELFVSKEPVEPVIWCTKVPQSTKDPVRKQLFSANLNLKKKSSPSVSTRLPFKVRSGTVGTPEKEDSPVSHSTAGVPADLSLPRILPKTPVTTQNISLSHSDPNRKNGKFLFDDDYDDVDLDSILNFEGPWNKVTLEIPVGNDSGMSGYSPILQDVRVVAVENVNFQADTDQASCSYDPEDFEVFAGSSDDTGQRSKSPIPDRDETAGTQNGNLGSEQIDATPAIDENPVSPNAENNEDQVDDSVSETLPDVNNGGKRKRCNIPKKVTRKRTLNPNSWKKNTRKIAKNLGQEYISSKGKLIAAAQMRNACACKKECRHLITEDKRKIVFQRFWAIGDHTRHWDYITHHVTQECVKKRTTDNEDSRRQTSRRYYLEVDSKKIQVCKTMFLNTLGIWQGWIDSAFAHLEKGTAGTMSPDKRGRHNNRPTKTTEEKKETVRAHINKYPRVPSHYTRARSQREYLEWGLSMQLMVRHYKTWCEEENVPLNSRASAREYINVLVTEFNISFFKPKKDQCSLCHVMRKGTRVERERLKDKYVDHIKSKKAARKEMDDAKKLGISNQNVTVCAFDLQKVLPLPKSESSVFFYENKLSLYNLSVFHMVDKVGTCYLWHEAIAKRGANEVSSCLLKFVATRAAEGTKEILSFSDSCSGQNKNRFFFSMMLFVCARFSIKFRHCFLEPGHTQNENDSVHARIESNAKLQDIFDFDEWINVIKTAKVSDPPYKVELMKRIDVLNFHPLVEEKQNWELDTQGRKITWKKVKLIEADPMEREGLLKLKYKYDGPWISMNTNQRRGHPVNLKTYQVPLAYAGKIPLANKKIKSLQSLLKNLHIPSRYENFYNSICSNVEPTENLIEVRENDEDSSDDEALRVREPTEPTPGDWNSVEIDDD